jgi:hypothetical protein
VERRKISPRKIINVTRWAKTLNSKAGNFTRHFHRPRFRDERLETNIQAVRQRFIPKHFILKVIWRNSPNPGNPTLF